MKNIFNFLANPSRFRIFSKNVYPFSLIMMFIFIFIGLWFSLYNSPPDYQQGETVRIMYVHVPAAWMAMMVYLSMTVMSIFSLVWRHPLADILSKCSAPIGAMFTLIALVTGSIWGKPTWGTWWVWDARLTSTLILFFIYAALIGLHSTIEDKTKADRAVSILSIVGLAIIPVIKKSVDWWQTLHQPSTFTITSSPSMSPDMYQPLLLCLIGFYLFFALLLTLNLRNEILERERTKNWVKQLLGGAG